MSEVEQGKLKKEGDVEVYCISIFFFISLFKTASRF